MNRMSVIAIIMIITPALAYAHCDSLTGPVVTDARAALASGRVDRVLKWVRVEDESEVRAAFAQAVAVREQSDAVKELADRWFFETVVRLHRASEGEPFTGLRPADWKAPHVLEVADAAVARGNAGELESALTAALRERFQRVVQAKAQAGDSVEAGRAFVAAYTKLMHFIEALD